MNGQNTNNAWQCPHCRCQEMLEGFQRDDGMMRPKRGLRLGEAGSNILHYFCRNCGLIVYSRVVDTSPFRPAGTTYGK